ncbi:MAG: hypothetical protein IPQ08_06230 [Chitinophagaceae bacterium]|nr:hypothetical protein [Chitinophagaceae bacterium]
MGGVAAGSPVSAANTNQAFLDANGDDTGVGVYTLNNTLTATGPQIDNIQREHNSIASFTGKATNSVKNDLPSWTNNQVGASTDPLKLRSDLLTARFDGTTGHAHTGATGEGPQVTAPNIASVRLHGYFLRGTDLIAVTGTSTDVSTPLIGKIPSSSQTVKGVVVVAPDNKVILQQATGVNQGAEIKDGSGNIVYGRVTESVGVWTLSYFVLLSGVETAYNFVVATDVAWFYQELFNPITDAPVYSELATIPSDNITADIVDASATQRGAVNTADQAFGGIKRFLNQLAIRDASAAFDAVVAFVSSIVLTAQRTLTLDLKNADKTLTITSNADIAGTNSGDVSLNAVGSTPSASGASLSGQSLTLQPADSSNPGLMTAIAQSFSGLKTFLSQIAIRDTSAAFDVIIAFVSSVVLTAQRTFTIDLKNVSRTLTMSGDADISGTNSGDQTITLTSDVTGSGTGSFATTIANNAVTNAKAAQMAAHTFKGNNTGSTANAIDLTATQLTAELNEFVGDSGSGGTKGLVVAPATGDATKFLRGDATWQTVSGGSGGFNYTAQTTTYTAVAQDYVNCTSGTFAVTLPTAVSISGKTIKIKNSGTGVITINTTSSQTIDGYASGVIALSNQNEEITFVSDGANWLIDSYKFKKSTVVYSTGAAGTDTSAVGSFPWVRINLSPTSTGGADITAAQDGTNGCQFTAMYKGFMQVEWGVDQPSGNGTRVAVNGTVYQNIYGSVSGGSTEHSVGSITIPVAANDTIQIGVSSATVNGVTSTTYISATLEKEL